MDVATAPKPATDHVGARREKVGSRGRLHLDRTLPFLVVHRLRKGEDAGRSLARRVALNSPAYLIWREGSEDEEALRLLDTLVDELGGTDSPLLVFGLQDLDQYPEGEESQKLTPFVATVCGGRSSREKRAREKLVESFKAIEVDLRHPKVTEFAQEKDNWLVQALSDRKAKCDPLLVGLPQIHLREDGGTYPQLAHDLAVACGDALLQAAFAFIDSGKERGPRHYRSLGRSAFLKTAFNVDQKLDEIASSFDFLLSVSPINATSALEKFVEDGEQVAPKFKYRPLTVDPDRAKRALYRLNFNRLEDPLLQQMFTDKRHEIDAQLTMLATRNTAAFRPASLFLYGAVSSELLDTAKRILDLSRPHVPRGKTLGADALAAHARALIAGYNRDERVFDATVDVRDDISGLMVTRNRLLIGSSSNVPKARLDALLSHEISTHLLTYVNGSRQGLSIFRTGLAGYEGVQEGLGVFAEWAVGGLSMVRMRLIAARVVAVDAMQHGAEFMDTYRLLRRELGFSVAGAFGIATRVHRSGGLAKDAIYLEGFRSVIDYVSGGGSLAPFWLGKIARRDVPAVEELLLRGLVHAPTFLPAYLDRPDAQQRIERLSPDIALDDLFVEPA